MDGPNSQMPRKGKQTADSGSKEEARGVIEGDARGPAMVDRLQAASHRWTSVSDTPG